jgi:hypothetical protein
MADLQYNIESRILQGKIGETEIYAIAGSGGRAGSKTRNAVNYSLANNSFATHIGGAKSKGTHFYGPIPRGLYVLKIHESKPNWIRLVPDKLNYMHGRDGFAIHGRGATGSHGCIVPLEQGVIQAIVKALKKIADKDITLEVVSIGQFVRLYENIG